MRAHKAIAPALLALSLAGCGAGTAHQVSEHQAAPVSMHRMPDGSLMSDAQMRMLHAAPVAAEPSESAKMICADETHLSLQHNLGLAAAPTSTARWVGGIYSCTYHLAAGDLVVSVQDATDAAAGMKYFDSVRATMPDLHRIGGLDSLGLPGYEDGHGTVLFVKDGKTLDIDATALPASVGAFKQSPAHVAYALAASILACWSES